MNTLPAAFEERIKIQLPAEAEAFLQSLQTEPPVSIRLNPGKIHSFHELPPNLPVSTPVEWCENAFYLNQRPIFTLDPCFHGGGYYVQEASSMFLHHAVKQLMPSGPIRILDLCAAPGGKSTLLASLMSPDSLLISNEVIRSRAAILKENIIKWGQDNIIVTHNDPSDFRPLESAFDMILVDAPCSGEGMFRKDNTAILEWSENNLRLCSERQKRILSDIYNCLKPEGILIYSTCTYNPGENEEILDYLTEEFETESIPIAHHFEQITPTSGNAYGYHFYPHKTRGEGFFIGAVRKKDGRPYSPRKNKKQNQYKSPVLPESLQPFILQAERYAIAENENQISLIPSLHADFIRQTATTLHIIYQGCEIAELNNRKIKLLPALALWQGLNKNNCSIYEADRNTALTFLKKEDIPIPDLQADWILISYQNISLGWCKNIGNRLNNYYPKEWRIRMKLENDAKSEFSEK